MKNSFEQSYKRLKEIHELLQKKEIMDVEQIILLQKEAKELHHELDVMLKKAEMIDNDEKKHAK